MAGCRTGDNASKKLQIPVRRTDYLEVERAVIPGSVILRVNVEIVGIDCFYRRINRSVFRRGIDSGSHDEVAARQPPRRRKIDTVHPFSQSADGYRFRTVETEETDGCAGSCSGNNACNKDLLELSVSAGCHQVPAVEYNPSEKGLVVPVTNHFNYFAGEFERRFRDSILEEIFAAGSRNAHHSRRDGRTCLLYTSPSPRD